MFFNSYYFIFFFLPITVLIFHFSSKLSLKLPNIVLAIASIVFYAFLSVEHLPLLLVSILFNYKIGHEISKNRYNKKKIFLVIGGSINLLLIFYYKYFFFYDLIKPNSWTNLKDISFPLGISFYTFT